MTYLLIAEMIMTIDLKLNYLPDPKNYAVAKFLKSFKKLNVLCGGRGMGKTYNIFMKHIILHSVLAPGTQSIITEASGPKCDEILVQKMKDLIPEQYFDEGYFEYISSKRLLILHYCNSEIYFRSRVNANGNIDFGRGIEAIMVSHDEIVEDKSSAAITYTWPILRKAPEKYKKYICMNIATTPKLHWWYDFLKKIGLVVTELDENLYAEAHGKMGELDCVAYYGATASGCHNNDLDNLLKNTLDEKIYQQEARALFVLMDNIIWNNFDFDKNITTLEFDPNSPWMLSGDFGVARGSYIAWQKRKIKLTDCIIAVKEWQLDDMGLEESLLKIKNDMGSIPQTFFTGHDSNTRMLTGYTPNFYARKIFGKWANIIPLSGVALKDPEVRLAQTRWAICDAMGNRRLMVSKSLVDCPDPRGLINLIKSDTWPEEKQKSNTMFAKDGKLEHCRDALHHFVCNYYPPALFTIKEHKNSSKQQNLALQNRRF